MAVAECGARLGVVGDFGGGTLSNEWQEDVESYHYPFIYFSTSKIHFTNSAVNNSGWSSWTRCPASGSTTNSVPPPIILDNRSPLSDGIQLSSLAQRTLTGIPLSPNSRYLSSMPEPPVDKTPPGYLLPATETLTSSLPL